MYIKMIIKLTIMILNAVLITPAKASQIIIVKIIIIGKTNRQEMRHFTGILSLILYLMTIASIYYPIATNGNNLINRRLLNYVQIKIMKHSSALKDFPERCHNSQTYYFLVSGTIFSDNFSPPRFTMISVSTSALSSPRIFMKS